jgi:uncharacterized protein YcgL (UPF0745 family)
MPKTVDLDTFLVTLKVPRDLHSATVSKIRRVLNRPGFRVRLRRTVEVLLRRYPALDSATSSISR